MKYWNLLIICFIGICASANADWFLRGTQNAWAATAMESAGVGTNTVQLKSVVFNAAGNIKFDRFGDWKENYGIGGLSGGNIPVAAGTWDIKFFTDTKGWRISEATSKASYHIRGSFNNWAEGTLMTRVGLTDVYESCVNFVAGDSGGGPRFKVDPNGAWGDALPAGDFMVSSGWVKVSFNAVSKAIGVQQNLPADCAIDSAPPPPISSSSSFSSSSISSSAASSGSGSTFYLLRGTNNAWAENIVMVRIGGAIEYEACALFMGGDKNGGPRFRIDPNGGWGGDAFPLTGDFNILLEGWTRVSFNPDTKLITAAQGMKTNCGNSFSSSSASRPVVASSSESSIASSSASSTVYHLRGTHNAWTEGMLMDQIGNTTMYEKCVNFVAGDVRGTRFKIDPNGAWGDAIPANDFAVSAGWVKISFNSSTKGITTQQNLNENCGVFSSSSLGSSSVAKSSAPSTQFHLRGTHNAWAEGVLMSQIGTTNTYEKCINFVGGDGGGGPRFKIDPNGAWGDAVPSSDFNVMAGWVKISFNSTTKVITTQQNLSSNCGAQVFHLRGTQNAWAEGDLFESVDGIQPIWSICREFSVGDAGGGPRFKIDPNGGWGADAFPAADVSTSGWTSIVTDGSRIQSVTKDMAPNCVELP